MAKLIYLMNTSVDGYVAERDGTFDWSVPTAKKWPSPTPGSSSISRTFHSTTRKLWRCRSAGSACTRVR